MDALGLLFFIIVKGLKYEKRKGLLTPYLIIKFTVYKLLRFDSSYYYCSFLDVQN